MPIDLPDGAEVTVAGAEGDDRPSTTTEIEADLAAVAAFEPLAPTAAELATRVADRQARKALEKAHFFEHAEQLRRPVDAEVLPR